MTAAAPSHSRGAPALTLDGAIALLADRIPEDRTMRDLAATRALRQATGRDDIFIERRQSGRPRLREPYPELGVSMAGRGGLLLIGFSPTAHTGVDIEPEDSVPISDVGRLATDHFSTREAQAICSAGATEEARERFLRLWVAKEAVLKLTGRGVFDGLKAPDFSTDLDRLLSNDAVLNVPRSAAIPQCRVAVRRLIGAHPGGGLHVIHYCALAVCSA